MTPDYDRAAQLAYKTLLKLDIRSFPVDPLEILKACKNASVHTYTEMAEIFGYPSAALFRYAIGNKDAVTIRRAYPNGKICYEVIYDDSSTRTRQRFTLAHELGHILMKHQGDSRTEEKEADYFASQLLAPHVIVDQVRIEDVIPLFYISARAANNVLGGPRHKDTSFDKQLLTQFADWIQENQENHHAESSHLCPVLIPHTAGCVDRAADQRMQEIRS